MTKNKFKWFNLSFKPLFEKKIKTFVFRHYFTIIEKYKTTYNSFIIILRIQAFKNAEIVEKELGNGMESIEGVCMDTFSY